MRFAPSFLAFSALVVAAMGASAVVACSETTGTGGVPPVTGIVLRSESLTAGKGCGTGAGQVYRYAAVVYGKDSTGAFTLPRAANVFDCYVDGTFTQLSPVNDSLDFRVDVFVYSQPSYLSQKAVVDNASAPEPPLPTDANPSPVPPALAVKTALEASSPTWTTSCSAAQYQDVASLAVCAPLTVGKGGLGGPVPDDGGDAATAPASIKLSLASFPNREGGLFVCDDQFVKVRLRPRYATVIDPVVDLRCNKVGDAGTLEPIVFEVSPAVAPASYEIDVGLVRGDDSVLGQTICRATTTPGIEITAVCDPVP